MKKRLRVLALVDEDLVPPTDTRGVDTLSAPWKTEFDVIETLKEEGHQVRVLGIGSDLGLRTDCDTRASEARSYLGESYESSTGATADYVLGGTRAFAVQEIEVFQLG